MRGCTETKINSFNLSPLALRLYYNASENEYFNKEMGCDFDIG